MIEKWELTHFPFEKDSRRYKVRVRGTEEDVHGLIQSSGAKCGRPFMTLSQEFNWAFYLYELSDSQKENVVGILEGSTPDGEILEAAPLALEKEMPPVLEEFLQAAAKDLMPASQDLSTAGSVEIEPVKILQNSPLKRILTSGVQESRTTAVAAPPRPELVQTPLNPIYTFGEFVVAPTNRFAHAAAQAVAESPGKIYNPFFIYGGVGLGKTHLMQAIAHAIVAKNPQARILYIATERFMTQVIESIRSGTMGILRERFRALDLLLIDDIQFLSGSESTQEEFFHVFNTLYEMGKQIVVTSDRPPNLLSTLEDRLRSRFEWGLITDLKAPNLETRVAILKKKCEAIQLQVPDDLLVYIAEKTQSHVRELEGIVKKIHAHVNLTHEALDLKLLKNILAELGVDVQGEPLPRVELTETKPAVEVPKPAVTPKPIPAVPAPKPPVLEVPKPVVVPKPVPEVQVPKPVEKPAPAPKPVPSPPTGMPGPSDEDPSLRPIELVCFFPKAKESDFAAVRQKFKDIVKKHRLKIRLSPLAEAPYDFEEKMDYDFFVKGCQLHNSKTALVLGPPPAPSLGEEDFAASIAEALEKAGVAIQLIPWTESAKDYRYLNCALDLSL